MANDVFRFFTGTQCVMLCDEIEDNPYFLANIREIPPGMTHDSQGQTAQQAREAARPEILESLEGHKGILQHMEKEVMKWKQRIAVLEELIRG